MDQQRLLYYGIPLGEQPVPYDQVQSGYRLAYINFLDGWNTIVGIIHSKQQYEDLLSTETNKLWFKIEEKYL